MAAPDAAQLQVGLLGAVPLPVPLALLGGPLPARCPFRAGSKLARIDGYLRVNPLQWALGPTFIAEILMRTAFADGTTVSKQEVWTVLHEWGWTRKKKDVVPCASRPHERRQHLTMLRALWPRNPVNEDMVRVAHVLTNSISSLSSSSCSWMRRPSNLARSKSALATMVTQQRGGASLCGLVHQSLFSQHS